MSKKSHTASYIFLPLLFCVCVFVYLNIPYFLPDLEWGAAICIGIPYITLYMLIGIPLASILYAKKISHLSKKYYFLCIYNAIMISMPYFLLPGSLKAKFRSASLIFLWVIFLSVISIIVFNRKNKIHMHDK